MKTTKNSVGFKKPLLLTTCLLLSTCATFAQSIPVFPRQGTVWKYNQTDDVYTATAITGWTAYDFNDSGPSWQEGPALLAWEPDAWINALRGTVILSPRSPSSPNPGNGTEPPQHARYFRKKFNYTGPVGPYTILRINERVDDAAVFWLNGTEVGRIRLPATTEPGHLAWSFILPCGGDADCENTVEFVLPNGAPLIQGDNILAVSVHQGAGTHPPNSSDLVFGVGLEVVPPRAPTILSNSEPTDRIVIKFRNSTLRVYADASPAPTYQWYKDDGGITDATNSSHTITNMSLGDQGGYYAVVSNPLGSVTSRVAQVTYSEDTNAPTALQATGSPLGNYISIQFSEVMDPLAAGEEFNFGVTRLDTMPPAGLSVMAVDRSSDGASSIITLDPAEMEFVPPNTPINIFIQGLFDLSGNLMDETNLQFNTFVQGCGTAIVDMFDTGAGNAISVLLTHPNFINNNPYYSTNANAVNTDLVLPSPDNRTDFPSREAYGGRIRAIWIPPYSGDWVLYLRSDDAGELYLNPNGTDPAGKIRVAQEIDCCEPLGSLDESSQNMQLNLIGGKPYYIEAVYKEGTGGDYVQVGAGLRGVTGITPIPAAELGQFAPAGSGGEVIIDQHPVGPSGVVIVGTPATFTARASSSLSGVPVCYQWQKNGADILGANGSIYSFTPDMTDDMAEFRVRVTVMGGDSELSNPAILDVDIDDDPPLLVSASTDVNRTNVIVTFNESVDAVTATNTANYSIPGATITEILPSGASAVNLLLAAPLNTCQTYNLNVSNVRDRYDNVIAPSSASFTAPIVLVNWDAATIWRYDDSGNTNLGAAWTERLYDDSGWSNGAAALAFEPNPWVGETPVRTPISGTTTNTTAYFRVHFNLPTDPSTVTALQIRQIVDDGAVYYINGTEVYRSRIDAGPVTPTTMANAGGPESPAGTHPTEGPFDAIRSSLRFGDNVFAAELHSSSATSSDSAFAATLTASLSACFEPIILSVTREGNSVRITSNRAGTIYKSSSLGGGWTLVGPAPQTVVADQPQQFFQIRP